LLKKIHHVGFVVADADEALKFWRDTLGLSVTKDKVIEEQGVRGVLMALGNSELELIQPVRPDTGVARYLETKGEGMHHTCFETDDIEAELEKARAKGLQLIDEKPRDGLAGRIAFIHPKSNHGVLVEFAQPPGGEETHAADSYLDHLAFVVKDLAEAGKTFSHNYDLKVEREGELPAMGIRNSFLHIGDADIELVTPIGDSGPVADALAKGEGMFVVSLRVPDLDGAVARLRDSGVRVSDPAGATEGIRLSFVSMKATHGVNLQLIERS
jgi:methylmalonyl-CoA epimerase